MEVYLLLSFKKHKSVCYLAELMLALQCSYVQRSHKCPECNVEGNFLLSFKKHESVCYLVNIMLSVQCSYVQRSHKCPECKS